MRDQDYDPARMPRTGQIVQFYDRRTGAWAPHLDLLPPAEEK